MLFPLWDLNPHNRFPIVSITPNRRLALMLGAGMHGFEPPMLARTVPGSKRPPTDDGVAHPSSNRRNFSIASLPFRLVIAKC